jgi:hypothetical protein
MMEAVVALLYLATVAAFSWMLHDTRRSADVAAKLLSDLIVRLEDERRIEREQAAAERQELLERIQRPEVPHIVAAVDTEPTPDPREMDLGLVGAVVSEAPQDEASNG